MIALGELHNNGVVTPYLQILHQRPAVKTSKATWCLSLAIADCTQANCISTIILPQHAYRASCMLRQIQCRLYIAAVITSCGVARRIMLHDFTGRQAWSQSG